MTFRQVLNVLWERRWIVAAVTLVAMVGGFGYHKHQTPVFSATTSVQLSPDASKAATGQPSAYTPIPTHFDPALINSPAVMSAAAAKSHESAERIASSFSYAMKTGLISSDISVTATGSSPGEAQARANAVAAAYAAYLNGNAHSGLNSLESRAAKLTAQAKQFAAQVAADPKNQFAASSETTTFADLGTVDSQISAIQLAGDPATVKGLAGPGVPLGTSTKTVLAVALVAGLLAGIGIALLRDQFDDRLRSERETEELAGAPSLGELPADRRRKRRPLLTPGKSSPSAFNEAIRSLRTAIQVLMPSQHGVVVVTSPDPGEGKSMVAANLAVSWARTGKSAILVSGDLRRPSLASYFGPEAADGAGLVGAVNCIEAHDAVATRTRLLGLLQESGEKNLHILPAGVLTGDPADFLAVEGVQTVMDHLRALADVVIVDTPPAKVLADAAILASYADGVVLVTALRRTRRNDLVETARILRGQGATILGTVSNMSRRKLPKAYRSYGFGATPAKTDATSEAKADEPTAAARRSQSTTLPMSTH